MVNGMIIFGRNTNLDYLYQKSLRYQKRWGNHLTSLSEGLWNQWNILYGAEKRLVKLLLKELENVVAKVQSEIGLEILLVKSHTR